MFKQDRGRGGGTLPHYPTTDLDRPLGLQQVVALRITGKSAHDGGKVVRHMHRPPLPPGDTPCTHFCYRLSHPRAIVQPECWSQQKILVSPPGIKPMIFWFVVLCLNQLRCCVPQRLAYIPQYHKNSFHNFVIFGDIMWISHGHPLQHCIHTMHTLHRMHNTSFILRFKNEHGIDYGKQ